MLQKNWALLLLLTKDQIVQEHLVASQLAMDQLPTKDEQHHKDNEPVMYTNLHNNELLINNTFPEFTLLSIFVF